MKNDLFTVGSGQRGTVPHARPIIYTSEYTSRGFVKIKTLPKYRDDNGRDATFRLVRPAKRPETRNVNIVAQA